MKLPLPRRRVYRFAIYVVSVLLVLLAADLVLVEVRRKIRPGFETTRFTEPRGPDGSIDYLTVIEETFAHGVTADNNAAIPILQALGRGALPSNQPEHGITDRLNMPHLPEQGDYFVRYQDFRNQRGLPEQPEAHFAMDPAGWPIAIDAERRQWLAENDKTLAFIVEATRRPRFFIPFYGGYRTETLAETLLPHVHYMRDVHHALLMQAALKLEADDFDGFHEHLLAAHRLARLVGQCPTLVERLVAMHVESSACRVGRAAARSGKLTPEQAGSLAAELAAMGDLPDIAEAMNITERCMVLDVLQAMIRVGPGRAAEMINLALSGGKTEPVSVVPFRFVPVKYEESARILNRFYDAGVAALQFPAYAERARAMRQWEQEVDTLRNRKSLSNVPRADWLAQVLVPSLVTVLEKQMTTRMENRLAEVTFALAAFRAGHGQYPNALNELSPGYLQTVPNDVFSDEPLIYRPSPTGYTLRSVGPNMTDDGGQTTQPADDLVVRAP